MAGCAVGEAVALRHTERWSRLLSYIKVFETPLRDPDYRFPSCSVKPFAMKLPPEIRFLGLNPSLAIESVAREKALKLNEFCGDIESCRVCIDLAPKHQHQGRPFAVRVNLTMPGHELTISRVHDEDPYIACATLLMACEGRSRMRCGVPGNGVRETHDCVE